MALPQVDRDALIRALNEFDSSMRTTPDWMNWESNRSQSWALDHEGRVYPPKKILSMATGAAVNSFSGGPETNDFLAARGFTVRRLRESTLGEIFDTILERYGTARATQSFGGNHEIRELFGQVRRLLESWNAAPARPHLHVVASYGKGNWATIPWISVLDDRETRTTQDGTYVVYLFTEDGRGVYVKLAQGVTKVEKEHGAQAVAILGERAVELRKQCEGLAAKGFDLSGNSDLGTSHHQARLYEASTIAAKFYAKGHMPGDEQLRSDLDALLDQYQAYVSSRVATNGVAASDSRRLSLVGTWRGVVQEFAEVERWISQAGGWASWWSFPVREEALSRLTAPFYLLAHEGGRRISARLRVDAMATSRGQEGIECPWPDIVKAEWAGKRRVGDRQSEVFKTWFRIGAVELLNPVRSIDDFELAVGLSAPESVLNQNTFGYVIEDDPPTSRGVAAELVPEPLSIPEVPALDIDWLVQSTGLRRELLVEMVDSLMGDSPQIMLAGPPGTSKTWLARQLATFVTRNRPELVRFVQFHPSYSYESFMEGLRPVNRGNGIGFELTPGVVVELVRSMHRTQSVNREGTEFVIVIDEANRANLPRVLGELMFLFEYRGQAVKLQYSGDFSLPHNLRFIGTMNTADRSIRSIDVALRRRFDVFEVGPDSGLLAKHYERGATCSIPELVDGFSALNLALETHLDRHHTIGHTFFMRSSLDAAALARIWRRRVFPLIEEYFFDQPDLAKEFSLGRFWPSAAGGN